MRLSVLPRLPPATRPRLAPPFGWGNCKEPGAPPACTCAAGPCALLQAEATQFIANDKPCNDVSDCALADGICYEADTCGNVGVHKDNLGAWDALHGEIEAFACCDGADPCGASLACENQRCVAVFP